LPVPKKPQTKKRSNVAESDKSLFLSFFAKRRGGTQQKSKVAEEMGMQVWHTIY